jgi:hypothetical protein
MALCSNRGIYGHVVGARGRRRGGGQYIHWLRVTDEYILIFLNIEEYNPLHSSVLCSLVVLSVN